MMVNRSEFCWMRTIKYWSASISLRDKKKKGQRKVCQEGGGGLMIDRTMTEAFQ